MHTRQRILIVDDERIQRKLLSELLEDDYEVSVAKNGQQALQHIEKHPDIDLILLDIIMPIMDGFETCIRLKEKPCATNLPVLFLSAKSEMKDKIEAFTVGGVDYITKPFQKEEVTARVKTHLALSTARKCLQKKNADLQREVKQRKKAEAEQQILIRELKQALDKVKRLSGLLPICMFCKKIRDDNNYWYQVDRYIAEHSEVQFSHGLCPECLEKHYPCTLEDDDVE